MSTVKLGTLKADDVFRTTLTRRIGIVLAARHRGGVLVYLEPLRRGDVFEEKVMALDAVAAVDEPAGESLVAVAFAEAA